MHTAIEAKGRNEKARANLDAAGYVYASERRAFVGSYSKTPIPAHKMLRYVDRQPTCRRRKHQARKRKAAERRRAADGVTYTPWPPVQAGDPRPVISCPAGFGYAPQMRERLAKMQADDTWKQQEGVMKQVQS